MLRTIAVWDRALLVTVPLVVASLGQWGILFHGIASVRSSWSDVAGACVVDAASPVFIELIYLYSESTLVTWNKQDAESFRVEM